MKRFGLYVLILSLFSSLAISSVMAADSEELGRQFSKRYPSIFIDARGSRGGNGDIAATYLTISDWIRNFKISSRITFLIDKNGRNRLLGIAQGNKEFLDRVVIRTKEEGASSELYDFYMVLANPSGTYRYKSDIAIAAHASDTASKQKLVTLKPDATLIVQTVLGNTENTKSLLPFAIVENKGKIYEWGAAGIGALESGVYTDLVAEALRDMSADEVRTQLLVDSEAIEDEPSRLAVQGILKQTVLKDARVGLVYGITAKETQKQFFSYLQGLARATDVAHVLITPSLFRPEHAVDSGVADKLVFVRNASEMPAIAEPGKIYIVETQRLPHTVFVGLTALSMKTGLVPVGAGDGFLSAAISLGGPFVLTQVDWNKSNIATLKRLIYEEGFSQGLGTDRIAILKKALGYNYERLDFSYARELYRFTNLYRGLGRRVPRISTRLMQVALAAPQMSNSEFIPQVADLILQKSVLQGGRNADLTTCEQFIADRRL